MEGTYPLPEAKLDRFFYKSTVGYPSREGLADIMDRTTKREMPHGEKVMDGKEILKWQGFVRDVAVAPKVSDYAVRLVM
jgi:MoxR-like ATPase